MKAIKFQWNFGAFSYVWVFGNLLIFFTIPAVVGYFSPFCSNGNSSWECSEPSRSLSSWWLTFNPFEKDARVKLDHFPRVRGENSKTFDKPPPRWLSPLHCPHPFFSLSIFPGHGVAHKFHGLPNDLYRLWTKIRCRNLGEIHWRWRLASSSVKNRNLVLIFATENTSTFRNSHDFPASFRQGNSFSQVKKPELTIFFDNFVPVVRLKRSFSTNITRTIQIKVARISLWLSKLMFESKWLPTGWFSP